MFVIHMEHLAAISYYKSKIWVEEHR